MQVNQDEDGASLVQQNIVNNIETIMDQHQLVLHYDVYVDVFDHEYNNYFSDIKHKTCRISINNISKCTDIEELCDSLREQSPLLASAKRSLLIRALTELKTENIKIQNPTTRAPSVGENATRPLGNSINSNNYPRSESTPTFPYKQTKTDINELLHNALQKIHWGDDAECIKTLTSLSDICQYDRNSMLILQHEPLMNTLCNGLRKYATASLPACIKIISIFERMSYFKEFQQALAKFKVGSMSLSLLHTQLHVANIAVQQMTKDEHAFYIKSQNHLLRLLVSLLFNLSDDTSSMRKMVNKGIISPLTSILSRRDAETLILALRFLRRIVNVPVHWGGIPYEEIVPVLISDIFKWKPTNDDRRGKVILILREGLELIYSFSFHKEVMDVFKDSSLFERMKALLEYNELRSLIIRIFCNCSQYSSIHDQFCDGSLIDLLIQLSTTNNEDKMMAMIALMKLSIDKECSIQIAKSNIFTSENVGQMFIDACSRHNKDSGVLLHLIRNVADYQPQLIKGFDSDIVQACLNNKENMEALCDIFAVSSRVKMDSARAKFFTSNQDFVALVCDILSNRKSLPQLHLECVMFVSSVVLYSQPAAIMEEHNIVEKTVGVFLQHPQDLDIQTQCLFAFYRFVCHTETRKALMAHDEIVKSIISHSGSRNSVLCEIANSVLNALLIFDKEWADKIKRPRFEAFNHEWIHAIDTQYGK